MDKPAFTILWGSLGLGFGFSVADAHLALKFLALIVPIGYTLWRWYKDWKKG